MFIIIAAMGKKSELGYKDKLLWKLKADMKHFKSTTMGKKILMGRKTYESLPGKLPGREIYVATRDENKAYGENAHAVTNLGKFVETYKNSEEEVFICCGAEIYKYFLPYCKKMIITEVYDTKKADAFFPEFDYEKWEIKMLNSGYENGLYYQILQYEKF